MPGIDELVKEAHTRIKIGIIAYAALEPSSRTAVTSPPALFATHASDLGYALLLKRYVADPLDAADARSRRRLLSTVPGGDRCSGRSA